MQFEDGLVYLRPTKLAYVRKLGDYNSSIGPAWREMLDWLDRHGLRSQASCGYGLLRDRPSETAIEKCRYDACVPILPHFEESARRELGLLTLPPGPYARKRARGNYRDMTKTIAGLYNAQPKPTNLCVDRRRPIVTIYLDDPRLTSENDLRVDICIPVAAAMSFAEAPADAA